MKFIPHILALFASALIASTAGAAEPALKFGVGLFQPDRDKNDATYRPLADYLSKKLNRPVELRTVDSWEGLAKSLANGETDIALMGPWGYVLANHQAGAQVVDLGVGEQGGPRVTGVGGERGRLHLAKTLALGGNVLMLDEPSNDLDVETLRALEDALLEFPGCAMVISHDRWFLDRICTHILAAEGDSQWNFFEGNFQEYEEDKKKRLGEEGAKPKRIRYKPITR